MSAPNCPACDHWVHAVGNQPGKCFCPNTQSTIKAMGHGLRTLSPMLAIIRARTAIIFVVSGRKNFNALVRWLMARNGLSAKAYFYIVFAPIVFERKKWLWPSRSIQHDGWRALPLASRVEQSDVVEGFAIAIVQFERLPFCGQARREMQSVDIELEAEK